MTSARGSSDEYIIKSVDTAFSVLREVGQNPDVTLSEIARNLGETKPRVLRMLRTMERRSIVQRMPAGGYRLGHALLVLGTAAWSQIELVKLAAPHLEKLCDKVNETVQLRIRDRDEALCIAKAEPSRDLRVHAIVGRRRPLHAGSSKVLLAFLPEELQNELIPKTLPALTPRTIVSRDHLFDELRQIRAQGYAVSRGEVSEHLVAVSVPVMGMDDMAIAALNVAAPAFRTQPEDVERFRSLLTAAAQKISNGLGWRAT